ncbi:MAG: LytR/AlgR family response regulator transcription factor [Crocinitomicaceae bacterium]
MSQKIQAYIIDDEKHCSDSLKWQLEQCAFDVIEITHIFNDPLIALEHLNKEQPQVVFIDVSMPNLNGFDLLKRIDNITFEIIFTTAFDQFAIQAFRICALDYLLKPIREEDLISAISKIKPTDQAELIKQQQLKILFESLQMKINVPKKIALPTFDGFEFVETQEISHIIADGNYSKVHFSDEKPILVSRSMKELEQTLPTTAFLRIHQSHIINLSKLKKYFRGDGGYVILENDIRLPVSRGRKQDLIDKI